MTTGNREDYLINILRLTEGKNTTKTTELAAFMKVSPASVTEMLKVLSNEGLVEYERYHGVKLTEEGLSYARVVRKKHHVLENFLMNVLDQDSETAHREAHVLEHALSEESAIRICQMLGTQVDSDCQVCSTPCKAASSDGMNVTASLSDLNPGERGIVSHLKNDDPAVIKKLILMGFVPGRELVLDQDSPGDSVTMVRVDGSILVLDARLASSVYIDTTE
ncbi:MAG: metal-dependent transcriptional regulator [Candidatus Methanoplasma sp.]|jgi:DtxR family Mn-dependent transcriptional regulator|nr:metal-dependent transcriptional regulator [Candidatus Methanoplasma sp.]